MKIKQYDIWLANLQPRRGTEPGKIRPVVIIQTNILNEFHHSTVICPITTDVVEKSHYLRVHLNKGLLDKPSDILVDQIRAIDNRRFVKRISQLRVDQIEKLRSNLSVILDLDTSH
ncbi:MAG: type II toxin-antitoxin system PemK/MazF family toxin [Crocinitomicaceae bacterium]|nr:type II toxin-antitoxin system PemK/MazF family toxin [Crocinitomicaceae bacterium]